MRVHVNPYLQRRRSKAFESVPQSAGYIILPEEPAFQSAREDFDLEDDFADRFLAGEVAITDFPYYQSYVQTINAESQLIDRERHTFASGGTEPKRMLFIGSGPVPLSAMLLAQNFPSTRVDIMDINRPALKKGARVARKAGVKLGRELVGDAATVKGLKRYDVVIVSLEVGPTEKAKRAVLRNLYQSTRPLILLRGSPPGRGGNAFVNTRSLLPDGVSSPGSVETFDGYGETIATYKRREP